MQTVSDQGHGPIGVMDITGSMVNIKDLIRLRNSTKQRVVVARTLLFLVESQHRSFGVASGAQHGTVKVKRHPRKHLTRQAFDNQVTRFLPDFLDACLISTAERAADGGYTRQVSGTRSAWH